MFVHNSADEKKVVDQLKALVEFESQVGEIPISDSPEVHLSDDGRQLSIEHRGLVLHGDVNRPLMHQIGGRIWPEAGGFSDIAKSWRTSFQQSKSQLESDIVDIFSRYDLRVRYVGKGAFKRIYGIVTPHFLEVNQLDFREAFLEEARRSAALGARTKRVERTFFGNVMKFFHFNSPGFQVDLEYGLVYARNTGYDAFRVDWGRYVLVCSNGLKRWDSTNQFKWYHNHQVELNEFLNRTVEEGIGNQKFLEERIQIAGQTALSQDVVGEFISRMSLAKATKQRLASRLVDESRTVGSNQWALSQAFTYLGTHDKHISFRTKRQFTELGTDILEHSLNEVLKEEARIGEDGFYGVLLPNEVRYH